MITFLRQNAPYIAAGFLLNLASSFGQTFFISILAGEIQAFYGLSHGDWGGIYGAATMVSAVVMVWAGTLTDKFRVRTLGPVALIALALACCVMGYSAHWGVLLVAVFLLRLFGQGMLSHVSQVAMARWFVRQRGKALALAALGYAIGEAVLPLVFVSLMQTINWQTLWLVAAISLVCFVPVIRRLLVLERTPQAAAERDDAKGMNDRHWTRSEALRHPLFWILLPAIIGPSAWITALFFQQVHIAEVKGWAHAQIVAIFPFYTPAGIVTSLATGWLVDRYGSASILPVAHLPMAAGFVTLWQSDALVGGFAGFILVGISHGAGATLFGAVWAEFYGSRFIGSIKSIEFQSSSGVESKNGW